MKVSRIAVLLISAASVAFTAGCANKKPIHVSAVVGDQVATDLGALEQVNEDLYRAGQITGEESRTISVDVQGATVVNDAFVRCVRASANASKQLLTCFNQLTAALQTLNSEGVLGVKNPKARAELQAAFIVITQLVNGIAASIGATPMPATAGSSLRALQPDDERAGHP